MPGVVKVISTSYDKAKRLVVKVLFRGKLIDGKGDVQTPVEASPYGVDSNPVEGKRGIYVKTGVDGKYYMIGYLNTERVAAVGEVRLFSTDEAAALKAYIWLKNTGEIHIGGNAKHMARFEELQSGFNQLKSDLNALVTKFNGHTHVYSPGGGAPVPTAATVTPGTASTASIDNAKIDDIKTR